MSRRGGRVRLEVLIDVFVMFGIVGGFPVAQAERGVLSGLVRRKFFVRFHPDDPEFGVQFLDFGQRGVVVLLP